MQQTILATCILFALIGCQGELAGAPSRADASHPTIDAMSRDATTDAPAAEETDAFVSSNDAALDAPMTTIDAWSAIDARMTATGRAGCGIAPTESLAAWHEQPTLPINGANRRWFVRLPMGYDASRPYPVVFLFHGCGGEDNNVPILRASGETVILVRGVGISDGICWDSSGTGPDVAFFDAMRERIEAQACVDTSRRFAIGYSSGAWLTDTLDCVRADVLRAAATVAGGAGRPRDCVGPIARVFVHDTDDTSNAIAGSITERDRLIALNHCDAAMAPVPEEPAPCARYQGCDPGYPVIWCQTSGRGHDRQDGLAPYAAWNLFSSF